MRKADAITLSLMRHLRSNQNEFVLPNYYFGSWECDVIAIRRSGFTAEYEIKISVADFKKDFSKNDLGYWGMNENPKNKHDLISTGKRTNRFYFVVPEGLIPASDVPEYAGLIYCSGEDFKTINLIREAKILHKNKIDFSKNTLMFEIAQRCHNRYIHLYYENLNLRKNLIRA